MEKTILNYKGIISFSMIDTLLNEFKDASQQYDLEFKTYKKPSFALKLCTKKGTLSHSMRSVVRIIYTILMSRTFSPRLMHLAVVKVYAEMSGEIIVRRRACQMRHTVLACSIRSAAYRYPYRAPVPRPTCRRAA